MKSSVDATEMMGGAVVAISESGIIHRPVRMHLCPQTSVRPRYEIVQPVFVKLTLQPALQSVTAEISECDARPGIMWAARALGGRAGRSNMQVCVDWTRSPLGSRAVIGVRVGVT
jgi:hypothetical protein